MVNDLVYTDVALRSCGYLDACEHVLTVATELEDRGCSQGFDVCGAVFFENGVCLLVLFKITFFFCG